MLNDSDNILENIDKKTLLNLIQQSFSVKGLSESESMELAYAMVLEKKLDSEIPSIKSKEPLRVFLTHDVDWIYPSHIFSIIKMLSLRKDWISFLQLFQSNIFLKNIEKLIAVEKGQNVKSFFMLGSNDSKKCMGRYDIRYTLHHPSFKKLISLLTTNRIEIGLHSQNNFSYRDQVRNLERLYGCKVIFHRSHFNNFDPSVLWNILNRNGVDMDFSVGNAREVGFKMGIPRHYQAIDFRKEKILNTTVVPTILSDNAFFYQDRDIVFEQFKESLKTAKQFGASVAILFHPENMVIKPELWEYYEEIIHICKTEGALFI